MPFNKFLRKKKKNSIDKEWKKRRETSFWGINLCDTLMSVPKKLNLTRATQANTFSNNV